VKLSILISAAVAALALAPRAGAQVAPQPPSSTSLEDVVVVANRMPEPASRVGNQVTVITAPEISASQAVLVADIVQTTPGITVIRNGGIGQPTSVLVRGADSAQTMVILDGVPVNDPSAPSAGYDFGNLLTGDISRIEILRGAQSTLYGSQAIGGVVSITTTEPAAAFGGGGSVEHGSHGTDTFNGNLGGKSQDLSWRLAAEYLSTDGVSAFDKAFGGQELDASHMTGLSGRARYDFTPSVQLDVRGFYTHARTNFDGYDTPNFTFGDDAEYGTTSQSAEYIGLNFREPGSDFRNRIAFQYTDYDRRSFDPNLGPITETFYGIGHNERWEYQGTWQPTTGLQAVLGAQRERTTLDTDTPAYDVSPAELRASTKIDSGYLQLQDELVSGFTATAGVRHDNDEATGGHNTGQGALAWALNQGTTILRASVSEGFKAPALYQLFSAYGNTGLKPEEATSWDAGIEQRAAGGRLMLSATYFSSSSRNLIEFFDCSTPGPLCATEPFGYYANIARAKAHGVELQSTFAPTQALSVAANYTYTNSTDRSPGAATFGDVLPRRPKDVANGSVTYRWATGFSLAAALRYSSRSYDDPADTILLRSYTVLDLRASCPLADHVEAYGRVVNATDKHYETAYQYGTYGRGGFVGLRVTF